MRARAAPSLPRSARRPGRRSPVGPIRRSWPMPDRSFLGWRQPGRRATIGGAMNPAAHSSTGHHPAWLVAVILGCCATAAAQMAGLKSDEVNADQSVTFRYFAPTAHAVTLSLDYNHDEMAL